VVTVVCLLGLSNLALGFALAVACARFSQWSGPILRVAFPMYYVVRLKPADTPAPAEAAEPEFSATLAEWPARLQAVGIGPTSLLESMLWIAKLDTALFRDQLSPFGKTDAIAAEPNAFLQVLQRRSAQLEEWLQVIYDNQAALSQHSASELEALLLDQMLQVKASVEAVTQTSEVSVPRQFMLVSDSTHAFRDQVDAILSSLLRDEQRANAIPVRFRQNGDSLTFTRLGLEVLFAEWNQRDPERMRLLSAIMVDLDHLSQLNQRLGVDVANAIVDRCGDLLHELIRKDRSFDRIAQISGQRFLVFLGDTSAMSALQGAERIRQTIEATSFVMGAERIELTSSLAAAEWKANEDIAAFLQRLEKCLAAAKQAGYNRVCADLGGGPGFHEAFRYTVTNRTLDITDLRGVSQANVAISA
jgi:diguanylate cyclase (GGDEF)-like protein